MFIRLPLRLALAGACGLLLPLIAQAQETTVPAWLLPTAVPAGTNSAVFPEPRNDWLAYFVANREQAKNKPVDLIFDGDSITDGWRNSGKEVWAANYDKLNATDFGIGGDQTQHLLWRLAHGQVDGLHPKMVALMIGTNNLFGPSDTEVAEGVATCVHEYQKHCPDAVILLQAIFPRGEKPNEPFREKLKQINAMLSKLADGKKVVYVDFGDKFLDADGTLPRDIMPDGLHPNAKGYAIWADAIRPQIEKVFGPQAR